MAGKSSLLRQPRRGQEVVRGLRAPLAHGPVLVVALHLAPPDVPAVPLRPTTAHGPVMALLPVVLPPQPPNLRSLRSDHQRQASLPPLPPLSRLREPPSPVPVPDHALVPAPVPALDLLLPTASAKSCSANPQQEQLVSAVESAG